MPLIVVKILNRLGQIPAGLALSFVCLLLSLLLATALYGRRLTLKGKSAVNERNGSMVVAAGIVGVKVTWNHRNVAGHFVWFTDSSLGRGNSKYWFII